MNMEGFTEAHKKEARHLLQRGLTPHLARLVITIKSLTDVFSPAGKNIFITCQSKHFIAHTKPKFLSNQPARQYELDEKIELIIVFGSSSNEEVKEETAFDRSPISGLSECLATLAMREHSLNDKVRDYAIVNLSEFVNRRHSVTHKVVHMKLGGSIYATVECFLLESLEWSSATSLDSTKVSNDGNGKECEKAHGSILTSCSFENLDEKGTTKQTLQERLERHITRREYGETYKTRFSSGDWTEQPLIWRMEEPRKLMFWSIEGPDESESSSESELEDVYDRGFRGTRPRKRQFCKVGQRAKTGKISRLQKFRAVAFGRLERVERRDGPGIVKTGVLAPEVKFVEEFGLSDSDSCDMNTCGRRISDCSDCCDESEVENGVKT